MALELDDIQGVIFRGYGELPAAYFVLLGIKDAGGARGWLKHLLDEKEITDAVSRRGRTRALQVAFTYQGLHKLGLHTHGRFSCAFLEGMTAPHKQRILGDHEDSAPDQWDWGGTQDDAPEIHILLMLYAAAKEEGDTSQLDAFYQEQHERFTRAGLVEIRKFSTRTLIERKEHFGFHDGLSQPILAGTRLAQKINDPDNTLAVGEFILGYANEYGKLPESPTIPANLVRGVSLEKTNDGSLDFGRNGSYLVFRQLKQDVKRFWEYIDGRTRTNGTPDPDARDLLAAKMVGRWRSGAPLTKTPDRDDPNLANDNDFKFEGGGPDEYGDRCPLGSHVRRSNPRLSVMPGTKDLLTIAKTHRILRRGRAYGDPVHRSMDPQSILDAEDDGKERGLHFICFNADIGRQFEFIQHTWINNPKFAGLYTELDPLVGDHGKRHRLDNNESTFTLEARPIRRRVTGIERYVHVRGGAYFFLPGLKALRVLANLI